MIAAIGCPEVMASLGGMAILVLAVCAVAGLVYFIMSVARAADALERIADALEGEDTEEEGGAK